jgi:hypothetical protein
MNAITNETFELATTTVIGTALVLAPIDPQPIRDLNTPLPELAPEPEPTPVTNFDCYGSIWGYDTVTKAEADIAEARLNGHHIDEWHVTDRNGLPIRIVRTTDSDSAFLGGIDICVFPAECPDCGAPVTSQKWTPGEHRKTCPRHDPHF